MPVKKELAAAAFNARVVPNVAFTDPALIEELNRMSIHSDLSYEHDWQIHQLIVWDHRCLGS
jgi:alpha-ketoglutarate-dependent taurine dioxygenase